jgi:predicted methyltransferase MtxX (methanogen marker protein 4)
MFIYHSGLIFIEFKREGETTKKLQEHIHRTIRLHGFDVAVVDDVDQGKRVIDELVNRKP